jgi:hypothetical protein
MADNNAAAADHSPTSSGRLAGNLLGRRPGHFFVELLLIVATDEIAQSIAAQLDGD